MILILIYQDMVDIFAQNVPVVFFEVFPCLSSACLVA